MGAKQGRTKGNKQKAKYSESDGMHGKPGNKALEILRANGEDAYILGEIVKSEDKIILE